MSEKKERKKERIPIANFVVDLEKKLQQEIDNLKIEE